MQITKWKKKERGEKERCFVKNNFDERTDPVKNETKKNKQINKIREKYCAADAEKLHSQI